MVFWERPAKLMILGDSGAGKSQLLGALLRATGATVTPDPGPTIGIDFKCMKVNGSCINIWDASGADRFYSAVHSCMSDVDLALLTYSCSCEKGVDSCAKWEARLKQQSPSAKIIYVRTTNAREDRPPENMEIRASDHIRVCTSTGDGISHILHHIALVMAEVSSEPASEASYEASANVPREEFCTCSCS